MQKYSGAGNKFIIIDNLKNEISDREKKTVELCSSEDNNEIDGVIYVENSDNSDFKIRFQTRQNLR